MMFFHTLLTLDAILVLYAGYRDFKEFSLSTRFFIITMISFIVLSGVAYVSISPLPAVTAAIMTAASLVLIHMDLLGIGDLIVYTRYPFIISTLAIVNRVELAAATFTVLILAFIAYYFKSILPMLCYSQFTGVLKVKREHFMKPNVIPVGVKIETDNDVIDEVKKKILSEKKEDCLDARVGYPLIGLFSISYTITVSLILLVL